MSGIAELAVRISAEMKDFDSKMGGFQQKMQQMGKSVSAAGTSMTKNLTLPLVAAGAAVFAASNEMDKAMKTIRAGTGATGEALQDLGVDFKAVFKTVPQDAGTVSKALADLNTRTGQTGEGLQELTRQMLNLARVSGDDVNALVASTTRLFGDWGVATRDQAKSLDYLWKVSQTTGVGVDALAQKMVQYGAPLRQMGFDMETAAAIMGKFEKEGVNLELVMGSLRIALGNFAREGEEAPIALQRLITEIQGMESAAQATALAMEVFGARAGADMAAAIREGRFEIDELMKSLSDSAETIDKAAEDTMTFVESMAVMKNEAMIAAEPLGKILLELFREAQPHLQELIAFVSQLTESFAALSPETQEMIVKGLALLAALGPVAVVVGKLIAVLSALGPVFSFLMGPIGLFIGGVAIIANGVRTMIDKWSEAGPFFEKLWLNIVEKSTTIWGNFKTFFVGLWQGIEQAFKGILNNIIGGYESKINYMIRGINSFIDMTNRVIETLNNVPGVSLSLVPTLSEVSLPRLEKGGDILSRGSVLVGERGAEILDLPAGARVRPLGAGSNGGNTEQTIIIEIDGRTVAMASAKNLPRVLRLATGRGV